MNLFVNYYKDTDPQRQRELDLCLLRNIESGLFKVHVLKDASCVLPEFAAGVTALDCSSRPHFAEFFEYINMRSGEKDVNVVANSDIYFDATIRLATQMNADEFYALTRHTIQPDGACVFYGKSNSQDAWILRGKPARRLFTCLFSPGLPRCDARLAYEAKRAGYVVSNPSLHIKIYHEHHSGVRHYDYKAWSDRIEGDIMHVPPQTIEEARAGENDCELPFVSVVIPLYNDSERLRTCLGALERQTYPKDRFEVIVVDNGSTEQLFDVAKVFPFATVVCEPIPGSYAARNTGIAAARGDVLAFTDSDCIPSCPWLENGVGTLRTIGTGGFVGGSIEVVVADKKKPRAVEVYESRFGFPQKFYVEKCGFGATANIMAYREVFTKVGQFNHKLRSGGDHDWGKRAQKAGYKAVYCADAIVRHPARRTFRDMGKKNARITGGFYMRHKGNPKFFRIMLEFSIYPALTAISPAVWACEHVRTFRARMQIVLVAFYIAWVRLLETIRLACAGTPKRI
jgi:glycosyltransferase involved in cell wall biosynthesis